MKLILSSCDFGNPESAKFICDHLCKSIEQSRVLFFPNEKATEDKIKNGKYENRLSAFGFRKKNIYVFNYCNPEPFYKLDIDIIYISGGNTFGTLKRIRDTGFDKAIIDYVGNGVTYVGGSAGAHIASADISHVAKYDIDTYGLTDFSGLGLYNGIMICHYNDARESDLAQLKSEGKYPVIALRDNESIVIRDE
ncbi:MAG: Type 1 glutamine amidotransferase-like domain-containing protein [Clostridia bacterium]|nr:Type 1 glutamine amidotransferase-like domain-containing protein [Clostridia bacterium]